MSHGLFNIIFHLKLISIVYWLQFIVSKSQFVFCNFTPTHDYGFEKYLFFHCHMIFSKISPTQNVQFQRVYPDSQTRNRH